MYHQGEKLVYRMEGTNEGQHYEALATRASALEHPGDHVYIKRGTPASWADGRKRILGEGSIDFDITLAQLDPQHEVGAILIRHVPPRRPQLRLAAPWMREPVANTQNNWVEVTHEAGRYAAEVGKETFEVRLVVSLSDGRILSGTLDNPVQAQ
ncbi:MAG: hypothetical protein WBE92_04035 [Steroidobacteraceae bacterium]